MNHEKLIKEIAKDLCNKSLWEMTPQEKEISERLLRAGYLYIWQSPELNAPVYKIPQRDE